MSLRRIVPRLSALSSPARSFSSSAASLSSKAPALADIKPDRGHEFDRRQDAWRKEMADAAAKRKEAESTTYTSSQES